jgi:hypothetical protein
MDDVLPRVYAHYRVVDQNLYPEFHIAFAAAFYLPRSLSAFTGQQRHQVDLR